MQECLWKYWKIDHCILIHSSSLQLNNTEMYTIFRVLNYTLVFWRELFTLNTIVLLKPNWTPAEVKFLKNLYHQQVDSEKGPEYIRSVSSANPVQARFMKA